MGLTGLEPVTLRLSSACSNQLSYRPKVRSYHVGLSAAIWTAAASPTNLLGKALRKSVG